MICLESYFKFYVEVEVEVVVEVEVEVEVVRVLRYIFGCSFKLRFRICNQTQFIRTSIFYLSLPFQRKHQNQEIGVRNIFRIHWRDSVQFLGNFVFLERQSTIVGKFRIFVDTEYTIWSSSGV